LAPQLWTHKDIIKNAICYIWKYYFVLHLHDVPNSICTHEQQASPKIFANGVKIFSASREDFPHHTVSLNPLLDSTSWRQIFQKGYSSRENSNLIG
jgi:hypothetical protein